MTITTLVRNMQEFTDRLALARCAHDRDDVGRDRRRLGAHDNQRVVLLNRSRALCTGATPPTLDLRPTTGIPLTGTDAVYLGLVDPEAPSIAGDSAEPVEVFAIAIDDMTAQEIEPDARRWCALREVATTLDDVDVGLFTEALAMQNFHDAHRFSPRDGASMASSRSGWVLHSERSGERTFPRTDPAIIVGVVDGEGRILLGANARWQPKRYSTFAGFVEPGESLEAAARREVWEEAGARITNLRYLGSQPWPFPASLMVAYLADLDPTQNPDTVQCDGEEIVEVRWFDRDSITSIVDLLPGREAIARVIIEEWYGGPLGAE